MPEAVLPSVQSQLITYAARACILPDDGIVEWAAGCAVPDDGSFTLVGDADGEDLTWKDLRDCQRILNDLARIVPDLHRVMLDPPWLGINLAVLLPGGTHPLPRVVEKHAAGGCGALVDGSDVLSRHELNVQPEVI